MQTLDEQIAATKKELAQTKNRLKVLENKYSDVTRRERAHHLIERGAMLESQVQGLDALDNRQVMALLVAALSSAEAQAQLAAFGLG